ncbi:MAG: NusG domain II-containing protein [Ignavibacteriae bacterium]|nr:NusG domain II-containing protein [Ignavibacteriota bacterium]
MDRRDFLKASSLFMAAGILIPKVAKSMLAFPFGSDVDNFSLEVITGNSDYAIKLLEEFIKEGNFGKGSFNYSEYAISNNIMGDLVFIKDNVLTDYTKETDDISLRLKEIRKKLDLPSIISNPVRIRLYRNTGSEVRKIMVAQNGKIISRLDPADSNIHTFYGKSGKLILDVNSGKARVKDVECKHKICKQMSSIKKPGDYITCIPNGLQIFAE